MTSTISKGIALSTSIDAQMYLCRSSNHKKINNLRLILLAIQSINMSLCFIIQLALPADLLWFCLIARSLMLTYFFLNFSSSILTCTQYTSFWTSNFLSLSYHPNLNLDEFLSRFQNYRDILILWLLKWRL